MVSASAAGKCILFGEHAVVYGEPAVAVAVDARVQVKIEPCKDEWKLDGSPFDENRHPHIAYLKNQLFDDDSPPYAMYVQSHLFSAAGMGSSAALSSAMCAAMLEIQGEPLENERIATLAHLAEAAAQAGRASPTDTSTTTLGGCVFLSNDKEEIADWQYTRTLETPAGLKSWEVHSVSLPAVTQDAWLVVGYTGIHAPTVTMVEKVAELLAEHPEKMADIERMGVVAREGVRALSNGDLKVVGALMDEAHELLRGVGVSCPELDRLVEVARPTSLGAKLTGAGGGGCMLALTLEPKATSQAIELLGGRVITTPLGAPSVRIEN